MRKRLCLILSILAIIAILGGCSNSDQSSSAEENGEEANTSETDSGEGQEEDKKEEEKESGESEKSGSSKKVVYDETNNVINVSAFEMGYDPKEIILKKGVEYELIMTNDGEVFHDLTTKELKADITFKGEMADHPESMSMIDQLFGVKKVHADGGGHEKQSFHMNAKPGQTVKLKFIPTEEGTYEFGCTVPGHKEAGMAGTIKVVE
ncbi:plastocyanin/azurin family copper-binding protein [Halobacillus mangrovi]|uniref:plastocyanin/azurin family copper-binding protein n=1 Tax=Halobacillus mangrovi TaxID=402384 RepID=UPI003D99B619